MENNGLYIEISGSSIEDNTNQNITLNAGNNITFSALGNIKTSAENTEYKNYQTPKASTDFIPYVCLDESHSSNDYKYADSKNKANLSTWLDTGFQNQPLKQISFSEGKKSILVPFIIKQGNATATDNDGKLTAEAKGVKIISQGKLVQVFNWNKVKYGDKIQLELSSEGLQDNATIDFYSNDNSEDLFDLKGDAPPNIHCGSIVIKDACDNCVIQLSSYDVRYRVNGNGKSPWGYYSKGYFCELYGQLLTNGKWIVGYRADADMNDDWMGASAEGTRQSATALEAINHISINPSNVNLVTTPGRSKANVHYIAFKDKGEQLGDLILVIKINDNGEIKGSCKCIHGDYGPQAQPGEMSLSAITNVGEKPDNAICDGNYFLYIVFANTVDLLKDIIGRTPNNHFLRAPTNGDIENAFKKLETQINLQDSIKCMIKQLKKEPIRKLYDSASESEKKAALKLPSNNNRE